MTFDLKRARELVWAVSERKIWTLLERTGYGGDIDKRRERQAITEICDKQFPSAIAEIERLRAEISEQKGMIWKTRQVEKEQDAQIRELKADLEQSERVIEARLDVLDQQAAKIKELESLVESSMSLVGCHQRVIEKREKALVEERARGNHYGMSYEEATDGNFERWIIDGEKDLPKFYLDRVRAEAKRQLQAEGKIGPDADAKPHCWQITEERKAAIRDAEIALRDAVLDSNDPHCWDAETAVLRAMLTEAE